jgi:hypothetical protein
MRQGHSETSSIRWSGLNHSSEPLPQADLLKPESIPPALVGIHTIIDCATARPEESIKAIDWEGKLALMQVRRTVDTPTAAAGGGRAGVHTAYPPARQVATGAMQSALPPL